MAQINIPTAREMVRNYAENKNGGVTYSVIFPAEEIQSILDTAHPDTATHVRFYFGLETPESDQPTIILVGVKRDGNQYKDLTGLVIDVAMPCPPNNCWDITSPIQAD
jgi:hypothetical protein